MKILKHIVVVLAALFVSLGIPFLTTGYFKTLISGDSDAVTSASAAVEQPSGDYVVLINLDKHTNAENLAVWKTFFQGGEIDFIFEDLTCTVAANDKGGREMAESFQSRLPENQMKIKQEDGVLMISKAEYKKFDIIIMSAETADMLSAETVYGSGVEVIPLKGEA